MSTADARPAIGAAGTPPTASAAAQAAHVPGQAPARPNGEREKIAELAREFEAFFILQMVRQMRQSMLEGQEGQGLGAGTMTDTLDVELGRQLANTGGIGLAQVLQTAIERQVGSGSPQAGARGPRDEPLPPDAGRGFSPAVRAGLQPRPSGPEAPLYSAPAALPLPLSSPVSSAFGWRSDPFHGLTRFHAGVDIAAAYGREVPAAGAGQVVFAGVQGGYGNTVVIEHPGGVRTRYAHLASTQVEIGERVKAGAVIGRVGSTGRSTGSHLLFEVLQDGRPVDPAVAATRFAGRLKLAGGVADSPHDQASARGMAAGVDDEDPGQ